MFRLLFIDNVLMETLNSTHSLAHSKLDHPQINISNYYFLNCENALRMPMYCVYSFIKCYVKVSK